MNPLVALFLYLVLLCALFRQDPAKTATASAALWVPVIWFGILASRLPSQWLGTTGTSAIQALEEGNWLDRSVYIILILLALHTLRLRSVQWRDVIANNSALVLLIAFSLLSVSWSDFPLISFRRWFRDLGLYLAVLVVVSDDQPLDAIHTTLRRLFYILIPLSITLVKYFPEVGRSYDRWTGVAFYQGVTLGKNSLGALCMISGVFFVWDTARRWPQRGERQTRRVVLLNMAFIGMTLWLLNFSASATSRLCLLLGCLVVVIAYRLIETHPALLKIGVPAAMCVYLILEWLFGVTDIIAEALGRDTSLTGRTDVWDAVLLLNPSPLLGAGYESFWLGRRLAVLWSEFWWGPNQAHNGYLEVYLNLGVIGLGILSLVIIATYQKIWAPTHTDLAPLGLALWTILLGYNVSEAAFKGHLLWVVFLLATVRLGPVPIAHGLSTPALLLPAGHRRSDEST
jgi:exopolysaccharide production protein ExoQ